MFTRRFYFIAAASIIILGGAIFTFSRPSQVTQAWVEEVKLPLDEYRNNVSSFAIDGNTAVYRIFQTPPNSKPQAVINIYACTGDNWSKQAQLSVPKKQPKGYSNSSLTAIDGDTILVGVNVFTRSGNTWLLKTQLQPPTSEYLGIVHSVSISGYTVVIDTENKTHVFRRNPDTNAWFFEAELKTDKVYFRPYSRSIDIDGDTIVVGNQIFQRNSDGSWVEETRLRLNGENLLPPIESVAISGNTVVIGSPRDYVKDARGSVYIFEKNPATGVWSYETKLEPNDVPNFTNLIAIYYGFGFSVGIDGDTIVVGTGVPKTNSPEWGWHPRRNAYVFVRNSRGRWLLRQKLIPKDYQQVADSYGQIVRVSGSRIIVYGAPLKKTYVFRRVNSL